MAAEQHLDGAARQTQAGTVATPGFGLQGGARRRDKGWWQLSRRIPAPLPAASTASRSSRSTDPSAQFRLACHPRACSVRQPGQPRPAGGSRIPPGISGNGQTATARGGATGTSACHDCRACRRRAGSAPLATPARPRTHVACRSGSGRQLRSGRAGRSAQCIWQRQPVRPDLRREMDVSQMHKPQWPGSAYNTLAACSSCECAQARQN